MTKKQTLPKGWQYIKIGEIAEVATGGTPSTNHPEYYGGEIRWLKSGDVKGTYIEEVPNRISQLGLNNSNARVHPVGSVMLAMSGQGKTRGTSSILRVPSACSQSVAAILPNEHALPEIIHFAFVNQYEHIRRITGDNERTGLNLKIIREIKIPLPPMSEQKQIIKRLNEELSAVESARKAAEEQLQAAWELPSVYLRGVFADLPKERMKTIEEVCEIKGGKRLPSGTDFAKIKTNHPYIRVLDFENGTVSTKDLKFIDEETHKQIWRYIINKEDVYLSIAGTIGVAGTIPDELNGANLTENACRLVIKDKQILDRDYLAILLQSAFGQEQIKLKTNQVGQPKLALTRIATITLPLPSLEEQKRISSFLTEKLLLAKELERRIESQLEEINALPSALLGRAFAGQ